ncbi:hypothetical protein Misp01_48280 [Microtetraspora sp. NBRC 13810]|uniref:profilin family protein n=1 Tax=Microtetraspora sp. NBRC 13810 TaxID=3030990 RepID=UPI0024A34728|nr:profilin family protein [Microtetraspora sp. NBRC 13810]GLW09699.1 hypothetical protein Misp01_48280 [Microtetraspora sp. NBRC 13810]
MAAVYPERRQWLTDNLMSGGIFDYTSIHIGTIRGLKLWAHSSDDFTPSKEEVDTIMRACESMINPYSVDIAGQTYWLPGWSIHHPEWLDDGLFHGRREDNGGAFCLVANVGNEQVRRTMGVIAVHSRPPGFIDSTPGDAVLTGEFFEKGEQLVRDAALALDKHLWHS